MADQRLTPASTSHRLGNNSVLVGINKTLVTTGTKSHQEISFPTPPASPDEVLSSWGTVPSGSAGTYKMAVMNTGRIFYPNSGNAWTEYKSGKFDMIAEVTATLSAWTVSTTQDPWTLANWVLPVASASLEGKILQVIGTTNITPTSWPLLWIGELNTGDFIICENTNGVFAWKKFDNTSTQVTLDGNHTPFTRANAITGVAPAPAEVTFPINWDTASIKLTNWTEEMWKYNGTTRVLAYSNTPAVLDGNNVPLVRANAIAWVAPTTAEIPTINLVNWDSADVYLNNGNKEVWLYNGSAWALVTTVLPTTLDGNHMPVLRASATAGVIPTALEVPTPILWDTASVKLSNGNEEFYRYNGATWVLIYTNAIPTLDGNAVHISRASVTTGVIPTALEIPSPILGDTAIIRLTDWTIEYYSYNGTIWSINFTEVINSFFKSGTGTTNPDGTTDTTEKVSRIGQTGFGVVDASTVGATIDDFGTLTVRSNTISNAVATLSITAAQVDANSTLKVIQTVVDTIVTIASPATSAAAGRYLRLHNSDISTSNLIYNGVTITPGTFSDLQWNGSVRAKEAREYSGNIIAITPYNAWPETVISFDGLEVKWHQTWSSFDGIAIRTQLGTRSLRYSDVEFYIANAAADWGKSTWGSNNAWYNLPVLWATATIINTVYPYAQNVTTTFLGMGNPALPNADMRIYMLYDDTNKQTYRITVDKQGSTGEITTAQTWTCSIIVEKIGVTTNQIFTSSNNIAIVGNDIRSTITQYGDTYTKEINLSGTANAAGVFVFNIAAAGFTVVPTNIQATAFLNGSTVLTWPMTTITAISTTSITVQTLASKTTNVPALGWSVEGLELASGTITIYLTAKWI